MRKDYSHYFDEVISNITNISGIDYIYFLNTNQLIKEKNIKGVNNYLEQVLNIIKSKPLFEKIGNNFYSETFHTYTFLNENGLIIISNFDPEENLYLVVIAGENESVDLINLLRICKESRLGFKTSA